MRKKIENAFCAVGCPPGETLYIFPNKKGDEKRRKYWLDFFDLEEPNTNHIFACKRHFSLYQFTEDGIHANSVPDIPIICDGVNVPFKRKPKNWRDNVIVVTPRDPEFTIYRHETGVFPQNLFNSVPSTIQTPIIKSVSCSMATQTNKHLCGTVEISDILEEYRLNCFYCSEIFPLEKWSNFVKHLKLKHFEQEAAFEMSKYLSKDHDYTAIRNPTSSSPIKSRTKLDMEPNPIIQVPQPIILPPLIGKPQKYTEKPYINIPPPPLLPKPQHLPPDKSFNISLADQLIKLLNETVLNPNFLSTEEDNIVIIKNQSSNNIETSSFLTNLTESANNPTKVYNNKPTSSISSKNTFSNNTTSEISSRNTRPIYTLNYGQRDVPFRKREFVPLLPKNKKSKKIAQQTLKSINIFEKIYKTVKTRPPNVVELKPDLNSNKVTSEQTPLSRCLKRSDTITFETAPEQQFSAEKLKQNPTELVFEYTPEDIIVSLLDNMKLFPVLWEFHEEPFNKDYAKAVANLCRSVNEKWSLNITPLKMRRSITRILRFYRFMLPCESVDQFSDYFDKCALFLPAQAEEIPRVRCVYCWLCFKRDVDWRRHMVKKHKCFKWPYKCHDCLERFRERNEYELHKHLPHYKEIFKCEQCLKRFTRRNLYHKHLSSHKQTMQRHLAVENQIIQPVVAYTHECDICHEKFKSFWDLKRHKTFYHEPTKVYKCHLCPKEYFVKFTLNLHLKRHNKEVDFICEVCGKGFIRQCYLNQHMDTHTDAKITCNICNLKLRKSSLSRHLRLVHVATEGTIESTFRARCYHYKKYINPNRKIQSRKRSHEKLPRHYVCKICKINFGRLKLLKDHNKLKHSDIQKIPCKMCNIEFNHLQNLKRHYRCKHNLHAYQALKLVDSNEDLNSVLAMSAEELANISQADCVTISINKLTNERETNTLIDANCSSDKIQDEIMKAVETIDNQEMIIDDDHSMNEFFNELLKHK